MGHSDESTFSAASTWVPTDAGTHVGCLSEAWTQGRAIYGGLLMSGSVRALQAQVPKGRFLRSVMSTFVAPVRPGDFQCQSHILRSGSSFTHGEARIIQKDTLCVVVSAGFGTKRPPGLVVPAAKPPQAPSPDAFTRLPVIEGITPPFIRHFEIAMDPDFIPYSGTSRPGMRCWLRDVDQSEPWSAMKWLAMMDAPPPPVWAMLSGPANGSTIHFQASILHHEPASIPGSQWVLFDATVNASDGAYCDYQYGLWSQDGVPLAIGKQVFADFSGGR